MKRLILLTTLLVPLAIFGCRMELPEPETEAAALYAAKCSLCHPVYHPKTLTITEWKDVIKVMETRAENLGVRPRLTESELALILGYLERNARERGLGDL